MFVNSEPSSPALTSASTVITADAPGVIVPASHVVPLYDPMPDTVPSISSSGSKSSSVTSPSVTSPVLVAFSVYVMVSPTLGNALSTDFSSNRPGADTVTSAVASAGALVSVGSDDV